ncbi:endolytic transglycosylase MltG [Nitratiruptor sp. SB155-2]|uniref:endolytic transglycosylase MltG n=1 Tax=Nitratiruptor sp. (strain SB155-2) TaxID=387092 RepID=UPI0001586FFC|nr:endolytic transglycosylase MltG [Nitratiruptor sp. SB155-2]BAF69945.1 conserved hypothetical protein [Nitratiruptor sp. SB155-2]
MAKRVLKITLVIVELVLVSIITILYYFARPVNIESPQIRIPPGNLPSSILYLNKAVVPVTQLDAVVIHFFGYPQKGWIDIQKRHLSRLDFLYRLTKSKAALFPVKVIPGETTIWFFHILADRYGYDENMLQKVYNKVAPYPEGILFADTYYLPKGIDEEHLVHYLVRFGLQKHRNISMKVFGKFDQKQWFEKVVTIASIIQKEAASKEEMPIVASVIYNRLKKKMPLQMDGTLNYGIYSHIKVTHRRIATDTTRFNTYKYIGLPPYPVCIVGLDAIKAAIKPAKTDYLYFVKGKNGKHLFSRSYKKHLKYIHNVKKRNR